MRMQIAFRETDETRSGYRVAIAGGVIETSPENRLNYDECRMGFRLSFREDGVPSSVFCDRTPVRLPSDVPLVLDACTLEDLLACQMDRYRPSDFINAEFAMRETALEASGPGSTVYAFSGFVYLDRGETLSYSEACQLASRPGLGDDAMFFSGILGQDFRPEIGEIDVVEEMHGVPMGGLLQKPWWGFGEEAHSLPGTMRRGNYEQIERFEQLHFADRDPAEDLEYNRLLDRMRYLGTANMLNDPILERYIQTRRSAPDFRSPYLPVPYSAMFTRQDALDTLVTGLIGATPKF
ncbi:hypothetical protein OIU34_24050 [Pararhizobium sp. BT-229]|uniref:hypothetical protein n=1 Tax=Pararhizobium sp. BT-229 TaxID=2986923 RepID=UPI0021F7E965|nr:hypothetical protein [Pararhizobium sp. BT-229]MCV9964972.1 hypothetical protein [Pararhizobium sp. BT-229]